MPTFYPKYDYDPNVTKEAVVGEPHTIPTAAPYEIYLKHIPRQESPSTVSVSGADTTWVEVTDPPAASGQFRVDYAGGMGRIEFHGSDAGKSITVNYNACGTVVWAETYPDGREGVNKIQETIEKHIAHIMSRFRWWHIQRLSSDTVHPNNTQEHLLKIIQALAGKGAFFATSVGSFSSVGDNYHSIGVVRFYANQPITLDFGVDGDDAVSVYVDGRIIAGWFGPHGVDGLYYQYHNCIATGSPRSTVSESLYPNGYTLTTGWHTLVVLHSEIAGGDSADVYVRLTPSPPEAPGSGTNTGWVHVKDSPDFGEVILYWQEVDPISALQPLIEEYVNYGHIHTNLPLTSIRPAGTNRVVVQNDYGQLTIAPANTGWCHFNTDRPKFWFDRDVAVAGEIWAGPSYNQKVWHAGNLNINRWVQPGDTILLEALTERYTTTATETLVKRFRVGRPGMYRVTGELRTYNGTYAAWVRIVHPFGSQSFSTTSTSYVAFTLDIPGDFSCLPPGSVILVYLRSSQSTVAAYVRNVRLRGVDASEPVTAVLQD